MTRAEAYHIIADNLGPEHQMWARLLRAIADYLKDKEAGGRDELS